MTATTSGRRERSNYQQQGRSGDADGSVPVRLRILSAALFLAAAVFATSCLIYNAPASPAQTRLIGVADKVMRPYFVQDWHLFGPTPGTSNDTMMLQVRVRQGDTTVTEPLDDLQAPIDSMPRHNRVLPSRMPNVLLAFEETFANYATLRDRVLSTAPKPDQALLLTRLRQQFASDFDSLQRFCSAEADLLHPGTVVVGVRGTINSQPIVPFSKRSDPSYRLPDATRVFDSGWMSYVPHVAQVNGR